MQEDATPDYCSKPVLILGCGNLLFGDDGFGCTAVVGCSLGTLAGCYGTTQSCFTQLDDLSCSELEGCYWDTASNSCSGVKVSRL